MGKHGITLLLLALLSAFGGLAAVDRPGQFHPLVEFETFDTTAAAGSPPGKLAFTFLFDAQTSLPHCEAISGKVGRTVLQHCPTCTIRQLRCITSLTEDQWALLSTSPLPFPSGRMPMGAVSFLSDNPELALAVCRQSALQSADSQQPITCFSPNTTRPQPVHSLLGTPNIKVAVLLLLAAALGSWLASWLIVKYEPMHARFSQDLLTGPQKVHTALTPRIGGIGIMVGLLMASAILLFMDRFPQEREFEMLMLAGLPAFLGGLVEDITKRINVVQRLLLTMLSGALAAWLLGAVLPRIDVPGVDLALRWLPFAIAFTVFAVGGVANAINIIDGFNGLSCGYTLIVLLGYCVVSAQVGDFLVFSVSLAMAGALIGFFEWNWPTGRIFLGDGGAYLLGFLLAELAILLIMRNPAVSPWFPVLLLIYPVFETLFSMYRRHVVRGQSPGEPDGLHFHTLVYKRVIPRRAPNGRWLSKLERNNRVAKYFWGWGALTAVLACLFWQSTPMLVTIAGIYCLLYLMGYRRIVGWKTGSLHLRWR